MSQKALSRWLKIIIIGTGLCGILLYVLIIPMYLRSTSDVAIPQRIAFLSITALPCYMILFAAWQVATNIGKDRSFSKENARLLKHISLYAGIDTLYYFIGNVCLLVFGLIDVNHVWSACLLVFAGVAVTVMSACLSHLILKAADLQDQSDLTI